MLRSLLIPTLLLALFVTAAARADTPGVGLKPDLRLLIDISGSMKVSDPENLRAPAMDLIIRLLPEGAKAGVWLFGEEASELVPHGIVDQAWRDQAQAAMAQIDNSGQRTNIPAALAAATYDFDRLDPGFRTSIVLLTDGKVDIAESPMVNAGAARKVLGELAPELGATGIPVHTIALSGEADWVFLRSLAQGTGGIAEQAQSAQALSGIFLQALEMAAPTARVPVDRSRFAIDDSVREFTLLVFFEGEGGMLTLRDPGGTEYARAQANDAMDWFQNSQFALITVSSPVAGTWRVRAPDSARVRVTVISDLQLEVDPPPNSLPAGRMAELGLRLTEQGNVLTDPQVLGAFEIVLELTDPRGERQVIPVSSAYAVPPDGEYRVVLPALELPGRYQVVARLRAQTVQRELPMYVEVVAPPEKATLVTRGQQPPADDFQAPMLWMLGTIGLVLLVVWMLLRRRKRRKLELWQKRARQNAPAVESGLVSGVVADQRQERDGLD
jgi:hypothetical protein